MILEISEDEENRTVVKDGRNTPFVFSRYNFFPFRRAEKGTYLFADFKRCESSGHLVISDPQTPRSKKLNNADVTSWKKSLSKRTHLDS